MMHFIVVDSVGEDSSTSPIFPCRQQSVTSAATTSASAYKLQDASHSSSSASPWLSKERGISNGKSAAQSGYELHFVNFVFVVLPCYE